LCFSTVKIVTAVAPLRAAAVTSAKPADIVDSSEVIPVNHTD
jgi:hypothetical protein